MSSHACHAGRYSCHYHLTCLGCWSGMALRFLAALQHGEGTYRAQAYVSAETATPQVACLSEPQCRQLFPALTTPVMQEAGHKVAGSKGVGGKKGGWELDA